MGNFQTIISSVIAVTISITALPAAGQSNLQSGDRKIVIRSEVTVSTLRHGTGTFTVYRPARFHEGHDYGHRKHNRHRKRGHGSHAYPHNQDPGRTYHYRPAPGYNYGPVRSYDYYPNQYGHGYRDRQYHNRTPQYYQEPQCLGSHC